jgi:hypothetical protein
MLHMVTAGNGIVFKSVAIGFIPMMIGFSVHFFQTLEMKYMLKMVTMMKEMVKNALKRYQNDVKLIMYM